MVFRSGRGSLGGGSRAKTARRANQRTRKLDTSPAAKTLMSPPPHNNKMQARINLISWLKNTMRELVTTPFIPRKTTLHQPAYISSPAFTTATAQAAQAI